MAKKEAVAPAKKNLSQSDVPAYSLVEAVRVPKSIAENYAYADTPPLKVAQALDMQPNGTIFRMLCSAAIAYGLIEGGANAGAIKVLPLAKRVLHPLQEGDDVAATREAFLRPRVIGEFLKKYQGSPLPREDIAQNILEEMGVPRERTKNVLGTIINGARELGFITEIKGKPYVDLSGVKALAPQGDNADEELPFPQPPLAGQLLTPPAASAPLGNESSLVDRKHRVFVAHGKNTALLETIKKLLSYGELEAVIAAEKQTVSQPVPDKVMSDLRSAGAAILHIADETTLLTKDAEQVTVLNPNVLIEIGASMALFGRRFILLVKEGIVLPSNLQGLYEVRYKGDTLDGDATIKLLEAIKDIKNHPLPEESTGS